MPSPRSFSIPALLLLGVLFAGGNLWFTAARSTIPLRVSGTVTHKQRLIEKTPGVDDVYIMTLDGKRPFQIDGHLFDAIGQGQFIRKTALSRTLEIDGRTFTLAWSRDFRGMMWAMPLTVVICVALGVMAGSPRQDAEVEKVSGTNSHVAKNGS